jgi:prepilin-type N-terminal cleavage/methylation domain-containing protein
MKNIKGLSLMEVLIGMAIMGMISLFMFMFYPAVFEGTSISTQTIKYIEMAKKQTESLKNSNFTALFDSTANTTGAGFIYNSTPFLTQTNPSAQGYYYTKKFFNNTTGVILTDVLDIYVQIAFGVGNRTIGEDQDLDGLIDTGEDINNDGMLNSPASNRALFFKPN